MARGGRIRGLPKPLRSVLTRCLDCENRCVFEGLEAAISRRPPSATRPRRMDGAAEARLVQLACSTPPEGCAKWTLQLLADRLVTLEIVEEISGETVRKTLKKNSSRGGGSNMSSHRKPTPSLSARCRFALLNNRGTLNVYHRPSDPARPLVCFDEASKQLVDHVTAPIEASLEHPTQIIDYAAFPPEEARRLINKLEIHYTPKHGSWLNMAEIELGILGR